eukprot:12511337-Alexandrium_andersonii.AAC.1
MKAYGGSSPKGTVLWGNPPYLAALNRTRPRAEALSSQHVETRVQYVNADGRVRVHGGRGLETTQSYPPQFGLVIALNHA